MKNSIRILYMVLLLATGSQLRAQVPILNSYPSATATIFLDFDGHRVVGTSWNFLGPINCAPANLPNDKIIEVFNRVAEDFRPFNINITTDSTRFHAAPVKQRARIILTTTYEWYGVAGGVAFIGSFAWPDDNPAFIFTGLHNYRAKDIAEATSHEAGHTLGLAHQSKYDANCTKTSDYHQGEGTGQIAWAPIMGAGYSRNFTVWHNGPNTYGCNNFQDDLAVITSATNGFGYRPDDHGTTFETATVPVFANNEFEMTGVISQNTDHDFFRFTMPSAGRFLLDAIPYNVGSGNAGSNLDLQVSLYDQNKTLLSTYNPGFLLNSIADTTLNSGSYYLRVEGKGNIYASEYASLGSYSLLGKIEVGGSEVLPLRQFKLNGGWSNAAHSLNWLIDADEAVAVQSIEISYDGRLYETLTETDVNARSFVYNPEHPAIATYYRVKAELSDGRRYYSNTIVIREDMKSTSPKLISNPTTAQDIRVTTPFNSQYQLFDMNGRLVGRGQLQQGTQTLPAPKLAPGLYLLQFTHDRQQWTEKLMIR